MEKETKKMDARLLLVTTLLISICSIIYELLISSISSYLQGDSILQFSITIGLYMSAMGIGSYISKYMRKNLFNKFIFIEMSIGILGGFSSFILFLVNIYTQIYILIMYILIILIGIFVGLEIPILTRIIENNESNVRKNLANIFTFDYIGGLIGSIAFPILLFPKLGFITTAFLVGSINIITAVIIVFKYNKFIENNKITKIISIIILTIMLAFLFTGSMLTEKIEKGLYRDDVILSQQTPYQKIVMTKHKDDLRLFLDGNLQFSSIDEYRYHEALVHITMAYAKKHDRVLILGGGDGLAARELLKYEEETTGSIMSTDFISFGQTVTVGEAIDILKEMDPDEESMHYIYVTDEEDKLKGLVVLKDLLLKDSSVMLKDIMEENITTVKHEDTIDKLTELAVKYNLLLTAVVDEENRLVGVVQIHDIIDEVLYPLWKKKN